MTRTTYDAVVVGASPNGLAAAVELADGGRPVAVLDANEQVGGGVSDLRQPLARPAPRPAPHSTPARGLYLCSSSTPPGADVHGLCGYLAARAALRHLG